MKLRSSRISRSSSRSSTVNSSQRKRKSSSTSSECKKNRLTTRTRTRKAHPWWMTTRSSTNEPPIEPITAILSRMEALIATLSRQISRSGCRLTICLVKMRRNRTPQRQKAKAETWFKASKDKPKRSTQRAHRDSSEVGSTRLRRGRASRMLEAKASRVKASLVDRILTISLRRCLINSTWPQTSSKILRSRTSMKSTRTSSMGSSSRKGTTRMSWATSLPEVASMISSITNRRTRIGRLQGRASSKRSPVASKQTWIQPRACGRCSSPGRKSDTKTPKVAAQGRNKITQRTWREKRRRRRNWTTSWTRTRTKTSSTIRGITS